MRTHLPPAVYNEDVMESAIELTRFHLTYNAFPFHDARLRAAHRVHAPSSAAGARGRSE